MSDRENSLRELFQTLHAEDEERAPSYQSVISRRSPARGRVGPLVYAAVVLLIVVWWQPNSPPERPAPLVTVPAESLSNWHPPTDSLLRTPGLELLEQLPSFNVSTPAIQTAGPTEKGVQS